MDVCVFFEASPAPFSRILRNRWPISKHHNYCVHSSLVRIVFGFWYKGEKSVIDARKQKTKEKNTLFERLKQICSTVLVLFEKDIDLVIAIFLALLLTPSRYLFPLFFLNICNSWEINEHSFTIICIFNRQNLRIVFIYILSKLKREVIQ